MKNFLPIPSNWRDIEKRPIPTHAELAKRVAVLMEHVCRHDCRIQHLGERVARQEKASFDLEDIKAGPGVVQPLQPGEVIAPIPTPASERPWEREGWCNAKGECWWSPQKGPAYWRMVNPTFVQAGWLLPHYAIPVIPFSKDHQP